MRLKDAHANNWNFNGGHDDFQIPKSLHVVVFYNHDIYKHL